VPFSFQLIMPYGTDGRTKGKTRIAAY